VQDWDLSNDGKPETLRLMFATPRRWLEDGKAIVVERAPTAFGQVSVTLRSELARSSVSAEVILPERQIPERTSLRVRLPEGWVLVKATHGNGTLQIDDQATVDLTGLRGRVGIQFQVKRQ
jgi:hypothetical protein